MSWQASNWVTEHSQHKGSELLCLLMISNHAHADGTNAFPSMAVLARECRMSERQIQRIITHLEKSGELLIERGTGRGNTHYFTVVMHQAPPETGRVKGDKLSLKGDKLSGNSKIKGDISDVKGDISAQERVTYPHIKGDILTPPIYRVPVSEPMNRNREKEVINTLSLSPSFENAEPLPFELSCKHEANGGNESGLTKPIEVLQAVRQTVNPAKPSNPSKPERLEVELLRAFRRSRYPNKQQNPSPLEMKQFGPIMKAAAASHITAEQIEAATLAALERYSEARMVTPHSVLRSLDALLEEPDANLNRNLNTQPNATHAGNPARQISAESHGATNGRRPYGDVGAQAGGTGHNARKSAYPTAAEILSAQLAEDSGLPAATAY